MRIEFKALKICGLLSFKDPAEITFPTGVGRISGFNKDQDSANGVGKSAIIDVFDFVLFGTMSRGIPVAEILNRKSKKGWGELTFSVGEDDCKIMRQVSPSKLQFCVNGKDVTRSIGETNTDIQQKLGITAETGRHLFFPDSGGAFLKQKPTARKTFLESMFNQQLLRQMLELARKESRVLDTNAAKELGKFESLEEQIKDAEASLNDHNESVASELEVVELEQELAELELIDAMGGPWEADDIDAECILLDNAFTVASEKAEQAKREVVRLKHEVESAHDDGTESGLCPTCGALVDRTEDAGLTDMFAKNFETELAEAQSTYTLRCATMEARKTGTQKALKMRQDLATYKRCVGDLEILGSKRVVLEETLAKLKVRRESAEENLEMAVTENEMQALVVKALGDKGLKTLVVPALTKKFEDRVNANMGATGFPHRVEMTENFDVSVTLNGSSVSYNSLSGGERKRLDIACILGLQDLLAGAAGVRSNVMFLDEYLDKAIDKKYAESVIEFLQGRSQEQDQCIIVISHTEKLEVDFDREMFLIKENGETKIESTNSKVYEHYMGEPGTGNFKTDFTLKWDQVDLIDIQD